MRGSWFSTSDYTSSSTVAREALALPPGNLATDVVDVIIPKGTKIYVGQAAPLNGQPGGGVQIFVESMNLDILEFLTRRILGNP